ncbi:MAG: dihydroxyacetone kinase subunit DhaK [Eubacteriales bacterium]|nr:dihydroxyacetone kinase subunit DhaK [Christensenellaceae bacterium]MEA5065940.1 dihydroxyacetone kinase subunit DhaK [Eubacteriales bacterium]
MDGMVLTNPNIWVKFRGECNCAVLMKRQPNPGAFGIIISGGAANGPLFPGYVWDGLADAAVVGGPYGAPNAYAIYETGKYLGGKNGVLLLYNNFAGDFLNNDMAEELLALDGIAVQSVVSTDDIASAVGEPRCARSGCAGIALLIKLAGACAGRGMPVADAAALLRAANERLGTLSVQVDFDRDEVTFGKGFSGEPGLSTEKGITMRKAVERAMDLLLCDLAPRGDEELFVLINRMRNASYADSYRVAGLASEILARTHAVMRTRVANYSNITDVYGYDFAILCADGAMRGLLAGTVNTDSFML